MAEAIEMHGLRTNKQFKAEQDPLESAKEFLASWYQLFVQAAKAKFGDGIKICDIDARPVGPYRCSRVLLQSTKNFVDELVFKILTCSQEPLPTQPCIIDQSINEFHNVGDTHQLESVVRAGKNTTIAIGTRYHFKISEGQGVDFGHDYDLGSQIVSINMTGGSMRVRDDYTLLWDQQYNPGLKFRYDHEEKLNVPPLTRVTATVTTSTKMLEQEYTLEFHIKRTCAIRVLYLTKRQHNRRHLIKYCCCCNRYSEGFLSAEEVLNTLPEYRSDEEYCYFTLDGILKWIVEDCNVETSEMTT